MFWLRAKISHWLHWWAEYFHLGALACNLGAPDNAVLLNTLCKRLKTRNRVEAQSSKKSETSKF